MVMNISPLSNPKTEGERRLNEVIALLPRISNFSITGPGVTHTDSPSGQNVSIAKQKAIGVSRRAKTSAAWSTGETTTAFLLDSNGAEITGDGKEITVNFFKSFSANNFPAIADDETLPVFKDLDGNWYCPYSFVTSETLSVVHDFQVSGTTLQTKTNTTVKVLDNGADGNWATDHTGTEC